MADKVNKLMEGAKRLETTADVQEVVKDLARLLEKTVRSVWTVVYFFDRHRRDFAPARSFKLPKEYRKALLSPPLPPDRIPELKAHLRAKRHLLVPDPAASEYLPLAFRQAFAPFALLVLPMVVRGQVTGAVITARRREEPFSEQEIPIIHDMIGHAALVVSHMRLFDDTLDMALDLGKRIDIILTLDDINRAISSSLSRDRIIDTAMEHIERIVGCELILVLEKEEQALKVIASRTRGIELEEIKRAAMRSDGCVADKVLAKAKSCNIASLKRLKKPAPLDKALQAAGINSLVSVPFLSRDKVTGVLLLGSQIPGRFQDEETFTVEKISAQMAVALENARLYEDMRSLFFNTVASLANAIDAKSPWTKGHSQRVMQTAGNLAMSLKLSDDVVERVRIGGLLHDIGKIGIIEALLEKPAALSEDEFPPMRLHPEIGVAILKPIEQLRDVLPGILHHHEWFDGTGYPKKLKGEEIPIEARIISVADAFDAMVADRPYKKGLSVAEAVVELRRCAGSQFDPRIVDAFTNDIERKWKSMPVESDGSLLSKGW